MSRIAYNLKKIRGVVFDVDGVLSPLTIPLDRDGHPLRMTNMRDGLAIHKAATSGYHLAVISGARASGVEKRLSDLGIQEVYMDVPDKTTLLRSWMERHQLTPDEVAYAGDDLPDIEPMSICGLRVAPLDAAHDVKMIANYISPCRGGEGVARDLLEQVLRAAGKWPSHGERSI